MAVLEDWEAIADASASRYGALLATLGSYGQVAVAYSGGCDSAFLLKVATDALPSGVVGITAIGASLAPGEREAARQVAREMGAKQIEIDSHEIDNPAYVSNPANRCYFCKTELYDL